MTKPFTSCKDVLNLIADYCSSDDYYLRFVIQRNGNLSRYIRVYSRHSGNYTALRGDNWQVIRQKMPPKLIELGRLKLTGDTLFDNIWTCEKMNSEIDELFHKYYSFYKRTSLVDYKLII